MIELDAARARRDLRRGEPPAARRRVRARAACSPSAQDAATLLGHSRRRASATPCASPAARPEMWRDICIANRDALLDAARRLHGRARARARRARRAATARALESMFERARDGAAALARSKSRPESAGMSYLDLAPIERVRGTVRLPGSKSISNRTLLLAALADGDDARARRARLRRHARTCSTRCARSASTCATKAPTRCVDRRHGRARFRCKRAELFLGNAGTAFRPLTAVLALMRRRLPPVRRAAHARAADRRSRRRAATHRRAHRLPRRREGFPPLAIHAGRHRARRVRCACAATCRASSSPALLMALPLTGRAARVEVEGELISKPYVEITLNTDARASASTSRATAGRASTCRPGALSLARARSSSKAMRRRRRTSSRPARSSAAGRCASKASGRASIQGDVRFAEVLERMGASVAMGDELDRSGAGRSGDGQAQSLRHGLEPHSRRGDDRRGAGAVRRRHEHAAQHRELAREGDRPHRGDGDRAAQARRDGGGGRRTTCRSRRPRA